MWEESLGTRAGVHLIEGVRLMWGPLNTGFTDNRPLGTAQAKKGLLLLSAYVDKTS